MGVRTFLTFVGDFGSMMMGGGEVGRFDLLFGVGEGTGSVGWEGGFFDGRTGAGGTLSLRSSIKRWRRIGGRNGASRLPGWGFYFLGWVFYSLAGVFIDWAWSFLAVWVGGVAVIGV